MEMFFGRTTDPIGVSDGKLWMAQRPTANSPWSTASELPFSVGGDFFPQISPDGQELFFSSFGRDPIQSPTVGNIFVARRVPGTNSFGTPEFVQSGAGGHPSPDGLTFAFYGNNEHFELVYTDVPRVGLQDILLQTREQPMGQFGDVFNPWAPLNSSADDYLYQFGPADDHVYLTSTEARRSNWRLIWRIRNLGGTHRRIGPGRRQSRRYGAR